MRGAASGRHTRAMTGRWPRILGCLAALTACVGACSHASGHATRPSETNRAATTTTSDVGAADTTSSTTTSVPLLPSTTLATQVASLAGCPGTPPDVSADAPATTPDLTQQLVPIDALNVRLCRYDRAGSRWHAQGITWLALSVASEFEHRTNALSTPRPAFPCTETAKSTWYLLTFARDTKTADLLAGGCPVTVSNGAMTKNVTAAWYSELTKYSGA